MRIEADSRPIVLTGPNGAGKTNILEAVSLLSPGRGLRRAPLANLQRLGSPPHLSWGVAATVCNAHGTVDIGTGRDPEATGPAERRLVRINGQPVHNQNALADHLAMAWLTPAMDRLFQEGASERRRFLDRLVFSFDPAHAGRISRYDKALRERSRLLRDSVRPDPVWLKALEDEMATTGTAMAAARLDMVQNLDSVCSTYKGPFPALSVNLSGTPEDWLATMPALEAEQRLREALAAARGGGEGDGTTPGPHRSDMRVRHVDRDMPAELCSTGEQKILLVALVLAHARLLKASRSRAPVLLMDEVVAHLDAHRRSALFEAILSLGVQVWMTGTDAGVFDEIRSQSLLLDVGGEKVVTSTAGSELVA